MKITDLTGYSLSSPYGDGENYGQPLGVKSIGIVEVHTDTGFIGIGETYSGVYTPELIGPIVKYLKTLIIGQNPDEIDKINKYFGGLKAVNNASMEVTKGSITGLIGPNGAGKTTLFNIIAGNIDSNSGQVLLDGVNVSGLKAHELFNKGVLRTFQIAHEFSTLTVLENLMMVPGNQLGEKLLYTWTGHLCHISI